MLLRSSGAVWKEKRFQKSIKNVKEEYFPTNTLLSIWQMIENQMEKGEEIEIKKLDEELSDQGRELLDGLTLKGLEGEEVGEEILKEIETTLKELEMIALRREISQLTMELRQAEKEEAEKKIDKLKNKLAKLTNKLVQHEKQAE